MPLRNVGIIWHCLIKSDSGATDTIEYCQDSAPRDCITESEGSHDSGDEKGKGKGPTGNNTDPEAEPSAAEAVGDEKESGEGFTGKSNQKSQCSDLLGEGWPRRLLHTSVMVWFEVEKDALRANVRWLGENSMPTIFSNSCNAGKKIVNVAKPGDTTQQMAVVSDIVREKVPAEFEHILGKSWSQCSECRMLAQSASKVRKPNSKLVAAKLITHHITAADVQHIKYLQAVKCCCAKETLGSCHWRSDAFDLIKAQCNAKLAFLQLCRMMPRQAR